MSAISKEHAGVGLSRLVFLIRKSSKSLELYYDVARVYCEIKSQTISVSEGIKKLKEILIENTILLDAAFLDLKANSQINRDCSITVQKEENRFSAHIGFVPKKQSFPKSSNPSYQ